MSYWRPELLEGILHIFVEGQRKVHQGNDVFVGFLVRQNNVRGTDEFERERKRWKRKINRRECLDYLEKKRIQRSMVPGYRPRSEIKAAQGMRQCVRCGRSFLTRYFRDTPSRKAAKYCGTACDRKGFSEKLSNRK